MTGEIIDAWPTCPQCQRPRNARCLVCGATRDFFPQAYQTDENTDALRFCTSCDDVARLEYFRECPQCGHDYGDGYLPPKSPRAEDERLAWRILWLMAAGGGLLAMYFYWLFRR